MLEYTSGYAAACSTSPLHTQGLETSPLHAQGLECLLWLEGGFFSDQLYMAPSSLQTLWVAFPEHFSGVLQLKNTVVGLIGSRISSSRK